MLAHRSGRARVFPNLTRPNHNPGPWEPGPWLPSSYHGDPGLPSGLSFGVRTHDQLETDPHGDAELLRLGDEHKTFLGEIDAGGHDDAKGDPWGISR